MTHKYDSYNMTHELKALAELYPFAFNYTSKRKWTRAQRRLLVQAAGHCKQAAACRSEETKRAHNIEG